MDGFYFHFSYIGPDCPVQILYSPNEDMCMIGHNDITVYFQGRIGFQNSSDAFVNGISHGMMMYPGRAGMAGDY